MAVIYDTFPGSSIDTTKWSTAGSVAVSSGAVTVTGTTVGGGDYIKSATFTKGKTFTFTNAYMQDTRASGVQMGFEGGFCFSNDWTHNTNYRARGPSIDQELSIACSTTPREFKIDWKTDGTADFYIDSVLVYTSSEVDNTARQLKFSQYDNGKKTVCEEISYVFSESAVGASVDVLVVAGGGSGGESGDSSTIWGGGGAGGVSYETGVKVTSTGYTITVGAGGVSAGYGNNGSDSSFSSFVSATGGGRGGSYYAAAGAGGSGGGGSNREGSIISGPGAGIPLQGYVGGNSVVYSAGGGGGGAGGAATTTSGVGLANSITGASVTYGIGGAGRAGTPAAGGAAQAVAGTANRGNGGGGAYFSGSYYGPGAGGSGVVIVRYLTTDIPSATGGTVTTDGLYTVRTFTASGTFTPAVPPSVTTGSISNIDFSTATAAGNVTSDNGGAVTERGVCWDTATAPTTADSKATSAGTTGSYTVSMTGLSGGTHYYARAYATNANGTSYGSEVEFDTTSTSPDTLYWDINGVEGETYSVSVYVGGTTGTVTAKLGSTGTTQVINAGAGTTVFQGTYGGLNGLTFVASGTFNGYIDNVYYVLILGDATINWALNTLTNVFPINSSVLFKRLEDKDFDKFRVYRYLDIQFKDLTAYVTVLLKKEKDESGADSTKEFLVTNTSGYSLPFINKKVSMLTKNYGMRVGFSHNRLSETFTVCQFVISGKEALKKTFSSSKIISIS